MANIQLNTFVQNPFLECLVLFFAQQLVTCTHQFHDVETDIPLLFLTVFAEQSGKIPNKSALLARTFRSCQASTFKLKRLFVWFF